MSPYLFIIVADVLQKLIQRASSDGVLCHPVDHSLPCPVLQYADDTLILTKGDVPSMLALKQILDNFSTATGLCINFQKSTFVPMNVNDATAAQMATVLGCTLSSFPQTYLGLPLSPHKLRPSDFQPLISSFDRYLAGWKARLLSTGGRIVLVNAVLGSLPIYFMSSTLLPKTVRDQLEARRRAFFWTGEDKCTGAKCLVSWERVCQSRDAGGLGIKNMEDMNHCLLMRFVHKLHEAEPLPWKRWFLSHAGSDFVSNPDSYLSKLVLAELPRYRSVTKVLIGDGVRVSFWHDKWLLDTPLAERYPALFSHCVRDIATVRTVLRDGLHHHLRPRLTHVARRELVDLEDSLSHVDLQDVPDSRLLALVAHEPFTTRGAYHVLHATSQSSDVPRLWSVRLPTKIKFFGWLLHHGRLNTRARLFHRNIKPREESYCELCTSTLETDTHLFLNCPKALAVWCRLQFVLTDTTLKRPWDFGAPTTLPTVLRLDIMMLLLWNVWKARNDLIFEHQDHSPSEVLRRVVKDIDDWSCRYRRHTAEISAWRDWIAHS